MSFTSVDNFISEVAAGKFWRADFVKTYVGGTQVAGNWNDMSQSTGNPCQSLLGNLVPNYDFATSYNPWTLGTNWAYTAATHLLTRTANADYTTAFASVTLRMTAGCYYWVTWTMSGAAGTGLQPYLGGTAGTAQTTNATFREIILCGTSDKLLTFKAVSATGAGTVDIVSVQPVVGGFVPYNDLTEGALWHGGDVSPDTKHLVNLGAYAYGTNTVPSILMLVDVLGVYPRVPTGLTAYTTSLLTGSDSYTAGILDACQDDWNEQTPANTAHSLVVKSAEGVTGGSANLNCVKLTVSNATFTTGIVGSEVVNAALNSYPYQYSRYVYAWVRSTINLDAGDISFCTDESASLASSQDVLLPALTANTWTRVRLDVSAIAVADKDAVISIGMKVVVDKNQGFSVYWDDVRFACADYVIQNGTFTGNATGWTLNTGWAYRSNDIEHTAGNILTAEQTLLPVTQKCPYRITFDIANRTAGSVTVSLGGGTASAARSADGTYEEVITCGTTNYTLAFTPTTDFDGRIDNVICTALIPRSDETTSGFGGGNRMYYVLDGTLTNGTGATTTAIQYTNQAGVADRWNGATINQLISDVQSHLPHSGTGAGKFGPFIPLQAGDYGIRSIDRVQFSGQGNQAAGAMAFVVCKPIASIPLTTLYVTAERDLMNMLPSLPRVRDGACLMFLLYSGAGAAAGVSYAGYADFAWS